MNIIARDDTYKAIFDKYCIAPFKVLGINPVPFLLPYTIYIGIDPTPETTYPNIRPADMIIELPFDNYRLFGNDPRYILSDAKLGIHEIFHAIHLALLPTKGEWDKWGVGTGNIVDLVWKERVQTPSYEKFAWDGAMLINFNLPQWYIDFLSGKRNLDYRIGNAGYIMSQASMISGERYNNIRSAILDKYK